MSEPKNDFIFSIRPILKCFFILTKKQTFQSILQKSEYPELSQKLPSNFPKASFFLPEKRKILF